MKMIYICDYCQEIIEENEVDDEISLFDSEPLTAENQGDIMKRDHTDAYYKTVCNECSKELNLDFDFVFLGAPRIH